MTIVSIPANDRIERLLGAGGQTVFPFDFPVYADTDLEVRRVRAGVETVLVRNTDYLVTGAGAQAGGTIALTTPALANDLVIIRSAQPIGRTTDFADGGDLPANVLDAELNRVAISMQQLGQEIGQALRLPPADPAAAAVLPGAAARANGVVGFDGAGQVRVVHPAGFVAADVPQMLVAPDRALPWANDVVPTLMRFDRPTRLGVVDGTTATPVGDNSNPAVWIEKVVARRDPNDPFAQNPGALFAHVQAIGSGSSNAAEAHRGTWNAIVANAVSKGANRGTPTAQVWDYEGSIIGVTGFARSDGYPGAGQITTGMWGYAVTPTLDATTWANLPATSWATVGAEVNVDIRHPDPGYRTQVGGKGSTVGFFVFNFQKPGASLRDWTFGIALAGNALDGSFGNTDPLNYPGFHTGILVDRIRGDGIQFGPYMFPGSVGIRFPGSYAHGFEPAAAIALGNNKINLGQYVGATFNDNDLWRNANNLWLRLSGVSERLLTERAGVLRLLGTAYDIETNAGLEMLGLSSVASAVNNFRVFNAAAGAAPALVAEGDDANIDAEIRPKGTGFAFVPAQFRWRPGATLPGMLNGDVAAAFPANTALQLSGRGSDGTTRSVQIPIAAGTTPVALTDVAALTALSADHVFAIGGEWVLRFQAVGSGVNYLRAINAIAGAGPVVVAAGADTNIDLLLRPKGTGVIRMDYASAAAAVPSSFSAARYLPVKDSSGTTYYIPLATGTW